MSETSELDRTYNFIRDHFKETGSAPHFTELARGLEVSVEEGRLMMHALVESPFPSWFHPGTEWIGSFPPFSSIGNQYRISVDGERKWFAQCGFESLAMCWMFPGRSVRVDTHCLHSGEPLRIDICDGKILAAEPGSIFGYVSVPFAQWRGNLPYA